MIGLYCIVWLFNVSSYDSGRSLIQTNIKEIQGLYIALHLLHKEHMHLFSWNQVLIKFLNCLAFWAVLISSRSKFQIFGPWKLNDLIPQLSFNLWNQKGILNTKFMSRCFF